ncbi:MAG: hypothetical protein CRU78_15040 [Candidatus Accumulibacter phosphatis]|uniref:Uncharacterized protein n=1 Tax=Candidatus Accumulibacter phosphatis TaxID=327160 RepID=A0A6A7RXU9_9PROT|nr:hypothetical protein [Candidatus Accumulibacter phosphatis]
MSQIIGFLFEYAVPLVVALVAVAAALLAMGAAMAWPRYIALGYLVILMVFPVSSSYGLVDAVNVSARPTEILSIYRAHALQHGELAS